jgi:lipopolysaccharide/colanic/teichoic acid biosynthesis glycosyltransferase
VNIKNRYAEMMRSSKSLRFREMTALVQDVYSEVHKIDLRICQKQRWTAVGQFINKSVILSSNEQTTFNNNTDFKINNGELR